MYCTSKKNYLLIYNCWQFVIAVLIAAILILTLTNTIQLVAPYGLSRLFSKRTRPKLVIGYACTEQLTCGGWADRQKGIVSAYILSSILGQEFRIHMPVPCDVNLFLEPNHINWRLQDGEMDGYSVQWLTEMSKNSLLLLEVGNIALWHCAFAIILNNVDTFFKINLQVEQFHMFFLFLFSLFITVLQSNTIGKSMKW